MVVVKQHGDNNVNNLRYYLDGVSQARGASNGTTNMWYYLNVLGFGPGDITGAKLAQVCYWVEMIGMNSNGKADAFAAAYHNGGVGREFKAQALNAVLNVTTYATGTMGSFLRMSVPNGLVDGRQSISEHSVTVAASGAAYVWYMVHLSKDDEISVQGTHTATSGGDVIYTQFPGEHIAPDDSRFTLPVHNPGFGDDGWLMGTNQGVGGQFMNPGTDTFSVINTCWDNITTFAIGIRADNNEATTFAVTSCTINGVSILNNFTGGVVQEDDGQGLKPAYARITDNRDIRRVTVDAIGTTSEVNPISTYTYEFGDGGALIRTDANPVDYYYGADDGPHTITLTVEDTSGQTDTDTDTVEYNA